MDKILLNCKKYIGSNLSILVLENICLNKWICYIKHTVL